MYCAKDGEQRNIRLVVQEVMGQIVTDVTKNTTTKDRGCGIPVVKEDCMCKVPEGCSKNKEQSWRHDQAQTIHWQIVVNAV